MVNISKIPMWNICIANVTVKVEDTVYNEGRIIIDRDSFEFAGHLADNDFLIAHYEDGRYLIKFFCYLHPMVVDNTPDLWCFEMVADYPMESIEKDLFERIFCNYSNGLKITFSSFEFKNKKLIEKVLKENTDLIEVKI